jgi:hypothetical protein
MPDARQLSRGNDKKNAEEGLMPSHAGSRSAMIPPLGRRQFLARAGLAGLSLAAFPTGAQSPVSEADYTIRIAPVSVELAPGKVINTYGYNGTVPGPVLRLKEGRQVSINIVNDTDIDDIIHWHGLFVPSGSRPSTSSPRSPKKKSGCRSRRARGPAAPTGST